MLAPYWKVHLEIKLLEIEELAASTSWREEQSFVAIARLMIVARTVGWLRRKQAKTYSWVLVICFFRAEGLACFIKSIILCKTYCPLGVVRAFLLARPCISVCIFFSCEAMFSSQKFSYGTHHIESLDTCMEY